MSRRRRDAATTFQWLIERGQPEGEPRTVWLEHSARRPARDKVWTTVAHDAAMFPDRGTAERWIADNGLDARAVEHGFMGAVDRQPVNRVEAEREFLAASVAVWEEIERLTEENGTYPGLPQSTELRQRERAAWERYRDSRDRQPVNRQDELRLDEDEIVFAEAMAAEHGLAGLLDHLGLDGLGNEVIAYRRRVRDLEAALRRIHEWSCDGTLGAETMKRAARLEDRAALAPAEEERCGSFGCVLPKGHNRGQADVPENHLSAPAEERAACGCPVGTHDNSLTQIARHHKGNPWPIREKLLAAAPAEER